MIPRFYCNVLTTTEVPPRKQTKSFPKSLPSGQSAHTLPSSTDPESILDLSQGRSLCPVASHGKEGMFWGCSQLWWWDGDGDRKRKPKVGTHRKGAADRIWQQLWLS